MDYKAQVKAVLRQYPTVFVSLVRDVYNVRHNDITNKGLAGLRHFCSINGMLGIDDVKLRQLYRLEADMEEYSRGVLDKRAYSLMAKGLNAMHWFLVAEYGSRSQVLLMLRHEVMFYRNRCSRARKSIQSRANKTETPHLHPLPSVAWR